LRPNQGTIQEPAEENVSEKQVSQSRRIKVTV